MFCFSGRELALFSVAIALIASISASLITSIRIRTSDECVPFPDDSFDFEPVRRAGSMTASIHPAPETLQ
jgi:hypothetical protein